MDDENPYKAPQTDGTESRGPWPARLPCRELMIRFMLGVVIGVVLLAVLLIVFRWLITWALKMSGDSL
jgi:hypothetical protein